MNLMMKTERKKNKKKKHNVKNKHYKQIRLCQDIRCWVIIKLIWYSSYTNLQIEQINARRYNTKQVYYNYSSKYVCHM